MFKIIKEKLNEDTRVFNAISDLNINNECLENYEGITQALKENIENIDEFSNEIDSILEDMDLEEKCGTAGCKPKGKKLKILNDEDDFDLVDDLDDEDFEDGEDFDLEESFDDFNLDEENDLLTEDLLMDDDLDDEDIDDDFDLNTEDMDVMGDNEIQELADEEQEDDEEAEAGEVLGESFLDFDLD